MASIPPGAFFTPFALSKGINEEVSKAPLPETTSETLRDISKDGVGIIERIKDESIWSIVSSGLEQKLFQLNKTIINNVHDSSLDFDKADLSKNRKLSNAAAEVMKIDQQPTRKLSNALAATEIEARDINQLQTATNRKFSLGGLLGVSQGNENSKVDSSASDTIEKVRRDSIAKMGNKEMIRDFPSLNEKVNQPPKGTSRKLSLPVGLLSSRKMSVPAGIASSSMPSRKMSSYLPGELEMQKKHQEQTSEERERANGKPKRPTRMSMPAGDMLLLMHAFPNKDNVGIFELPSRGKHQKRNEPIVKLPEPLEEDSDDEKDDAIAAVYSDSEIEFHRKESRVKQRRKSHLLHEPGTTRKTSTIPPWMNKMIDPNAAISESDVPTDTDIESTFTESEMEDLQTTKETRRSSSSCKCCRRRSNQRRKKASNSTIKETDYDSEYPESEY